MRFCFLWNWETKYRRYFQLLKNREQEFKGKHFDFIQNWATFQEFQVLDSLILASCCITRTLISGYFKSPILTVTHIHWQINASVPSQRQRGDAWTCFLTALTARDPFDLPLMLSSSWLAAAASPPRKSCRVLITQLEDSERTGIPAGHATGKRWCRRILTAPCNFEKVHRSNRSCAHCRSLACSLRINRNVS